MGAVFQIMWDSAAPYRDDARRIIAVAVLTSAAIVGGYRVVRARGTRRKGKRARALR